MDDQPAMVACYMDHRLQRFTCWFARQQIVDSRNMFCLKLDHRPENNKLLYIDNFTELTRNVGVRKYHDIFREIWSAIWIRHPLQQRYETLDNLINLKENVSSFAVIAMPCDGLCYHR